MIDSFRGEYKFLSNFYPYPVTFDGLVYPTAEHAYQTAKATSTADAAFIASAPSPGSAKRRARQIKLRPLWDEKKVGVMLGVLRAKFGDPAMAKKLLATGDQKLVEGNTWGDTFWGVCKGRGQNWLGQLLMQVREELRG